MYNFVEIGIDDTNFKIMAEKACRGDVLQGFNEGLKEVSHPL
ncbi:MAG: hypothetical protein ACFWT2_00280 [Thermoanaerobacterium thermosaccharolyticum]|jgi:hypothetical protein